MESSPFIKLTPLLADFPPAPSSPIRRGLGLGPGRSVPRAKGPKLTRFRVSPVLEILSCPQSVWTTGIDRGRELGVETKTENGLWFHP